MDYNGKYVKVTDSPEFWAVDNGERRKLRDAAEVYALGLRPVVRLSQEQMDGIPIKGAKPAKKENKGE